LKGIADIYNHYALNSIATEDQAPITEEDVDFLVKHTKSEKLPIIVAVKGKMPLSSPGKPGRSKKVSFPQFESIIGFGYAETYCYGIGGSRSGRTRFTANLQFYVHPDYTKKRVGQSLLDRLIQSMSHGYG
jgi:L-amino acid N-acyltransferase YncA